MDVKHRVYLLTNEHNRPVVFACVELGDERLELGVGEVDTQLDEHLTELLPGHAARVVGVHGLELLPQLVPHVVDLQTRITARQSGNMPDCGQSGNMRDVGQSENTRDVGQLGNTRYCVVSRKTHVTVWSVGKHE